MPQIELTVPPIFQTQLTGFVGAASRTIRGKRWRVELYKQAGPRVTCDGEWIENDRLASNPAVGALYRAAVKAFP